MSKIIYFLEQLLVAASENTGIQVYVSHTQKRLLDLSGPWPLAPGPRPSCSDHVHSISGNLNQIA